MSRILPLLLLSVAPFSAQQDPQNAANIFSTAYNRWISLRNLTPIGTIDAHEPQAWRDTQRAWKELNAKVRYE